MSNDSDGGYAKYEKDDVDSDAFGFLSTVSTTTSTEALKKVSNLLI
jgi:hypothetical protein